MRWLTVPEASSKMGCSERQCRRRLLALQSQHPGRELLRTHSTPSAQQSRHGRYLVNPAVMAELIRQDQDETIDELCDRVGSLESLERIIRKRLARLEKELFGEKHAEQIADLHERLRTLADISGREKQ